MAPRLHNDRLHLEWFGETCFYRGSCIFLLWKDTRRSLEIVLNLNIAENYIPCHSMTRNGKRAARSKTLAISVSLVSGSGAGEQTNWTTCPRHSRAAQLCLQRSNLTDHQLPTHQTKIKRTFLFKSKRWPPCLHCAPSNYYIHCVLNKKIVL